MRAEHPAPQQIPALRTLWQEAFGDTDAFLDSFFAAAFSPKRCLCMGDAAALYWFDCELDGQKIAYIYAVATAKAHRGKGLCRELMAQTHTHLQSRGYAGAVLVPGSEGLFAMYGQMGYEICGSVQEFSCHAGQAAVPIREISASEYAALRRKLLPPGGIVQEGENLAFLQAQLELYAGEGFLLAAEVSGDGVTAAELLGDSAAAPGIVKAFGKPSGRFRAPGNNRPFAMWLPLTPDAPMPRYFGLAFD